VLLQAAESTLTSALWVSSNDIFNFISSATAVFNMLRHWIWYAYLAVMLVLL
jgi:hypothetical protein